MSYEGDEQRANTERRAAQQSDDNLDIEGYGMRARVRGHDIIVVILVVILFLGIGYFVFDHDRKSAARIEALADGQQQVIEEVSALTYVMTLGADERARLKLSMPESLRKKLRTER